MKKTKQALDLTEGIIWKKLLLFALPLLATSFIQQMYNTVDLLYAGNMIGKNGTASVGASSLVITCIVGFFTGLSIGIGVIVSHAVGSKDLEKIDWTIHSAFGLSITGGALLSILGIAIVRPVLTLMQTPEDILDWAVSYVQIYLLSMIPLVMFNMNAGIIRAMGDSRTPMKIQAIGGMTNIVMDYVLLKLIPDSVAGIAFATFFSQSSAAVLSLRYLLKGTDYGKLQIRRICIQAGILREVLVIGVPAGLQNLVITLSNVFAQTAINRNGVDAIAGYASYFKVELLNYLPIVAFGAAMMTFTGQNVGAKKTDRIEKGLWICIGMGIIYVMFSSIGLLLGGQYVFRLFNSDEAVIASGMRIVRVTMWFYWLYVILEVIANAIRGAGQSFMPMFIILMTICVLRTIVLVILNFRETTIERVAVTYPISWLAAALCFIWYWQSRHHTLLPKGD